jgi:hypothetical protein
MLEHGAYTVMLDYYYAEERPLPIELDELYRLVRAMLPEERRAVDKILFTFFKKRDDGYHNERADEEIATAKEAIQLMSEAGKDGAEKRWGRHRVGDRVGNGVGTRVEDASSNLHPPTSSLQPPTATLASSAEALSPVNGNAVSYIPLNDGTEYGVSKAFAEELAKLYPAVDVPQTLNEIRGYNLTHKAKRKTRRGIEAHINTWMSKEQNRGPKA